MSLGNNPKSRSKVWIIGRLWNCLDAHIGQIVLWQGWSCELVHCPGGNATDPIWRVLASSDRISSWTRLKPQHSNPNPIPLANQLWSIDFLTPPTPLIIPHRLPAFPWISYATQKLMLDSCKMLQKAVWSIPYVSVAFFPSLKQQFYCNIVLLKCPHVQIAFFEIHQPWQSGFSRVYSNCCCSCWFEPEIIKTGQSSHKMYSNNILNFQESTTILNACTKKVWKLIEVSMYIKLSVFRYLVIKFLFCLVWFVEFYGISTLVGYLMPNPFLCK